MATETGVAGPVPVGLSQCHNWPHEQPRQPMHYLGRAKGSEWVAVRSKLCLTTYPRSWRRGRMVGLSRRSLCRLKSRVHQLNRAAFQHRPLLITLTYPAAFDERSERWKRDLHAFRRRWERRWGELPVCWRLEYQDRGAPHYHLVAFNKRFIPWQWVAQHWHAAVTGCPVEHYKEVRTDVWKWTEGADRCPDSDHLAAATKIEACRGWNQAENYVAKYVAKQAPAAVTAAALVSGRPWLAHPPRTVVLGAKPSAGRPDDLEITLPAQVELPEPEAIGRHWGFWHPELLPEDIQVYELPYWAFRLVRLELLRAQGKRGEAHEEWGPFAGCWANAPPAVTERLFKMLEADLCPTSDPNAHGLVSGRKSRSRGERPDVLAAVYGSTL